MTPCQIHNDMPKKVRRQARKAPGADWDGTLFRSFPTVAAYLVRNGPEANPLPPALALRTPSIGARNRGPSQGRCGRYPRRIRKLGAAGGRPGQEQAPLIIATCRIAGEPTDRPPVVPRQQARIMADRMTPANPEGFFDPFVSSAYDSSVYGSSSFVVSGKAMPCTDLNRTGRT